MPCQPVAIKAVERRHVRINENTERKADNGNSEIESYYVHSWSPEQIAAAESSR
jgi:hypothetical protein